MKEPLLLTFSAATAAAAAAAAAAKEASTQNVDTLPLEEDSPLYGKGSTRPELGVNMLLDPELYEGIVSQTIIEPTVSRTNFNNLV